MLSLVCIFLYSWLVNASCSRNENKIRITSRHPTADTGWESQWSVWMAEYFSVLSFVQYLKNIPALSDFQGLKVFFSSSLNGRLFPDICSRNSSSKRLSHSSRFGMNSPVITYDKPWVQLYMCVFVCDSVVYERLRSLHGFIWNDKDMKSDGLNLSTGIHLFHILHFPQHMNWVTHSLLSCQFTIKHIWMRLRLWITE